MKSLRFLLVAAGVLLLSGASRAQTFGCRAAVSCSGPRGFSTQMGASMGTYPAFTVGVSYDRAGGFRARWNPPSYGAIPPDTEAIISAVDVVLKRNPELKAKAAKSSPPRENPLLRETENDSTPKPKKDPAETGG